jgi:hypothetical protein
MRMEENRFKNITRDCWIRSEIPVFRYTIEGILGHLLKSRIDDFSGIQRLNKELGSFVPRDDNRYWEDIFYGISPVID